MKEKPDKIVIGICMSHDAGVAVIKNGIVLAAINEERYSRVKAATGFPEKSLKEIIKLAKIEPKDINKIAIAGYSLGASPPTNNDFSYANGRYSISQVLTEFIDRIPLIRKILFTLWFGDFHKELQHFLGKSKILHLKGKLAKLGFVAPIEIYDHHDCHLASAYFPSGMEECLVISNDGFGDNICSKVAIGSKGKLKTITRNSMFHSIGVYYNYVTNFCGFKKEHHAGKTTGLAAYGDSNLSIEYFRKRLVWDKNKGLYKNTGYIFRNVIRELNQVFNGVAREHVAAGIQKHIESILVQMISYYIDKTGIKKVAVAGGVHANVRVNQRISEIPGIERLFIFQNMGDGGLALGAAYLAAHSLDNNVIPYRMESVYLGSSFSDEECLNAIQSANIVYSKPISIAVEVAKHLKENKIVARCDGSMEYGPRSLGNRSILYPAVNKDVNLWLNKQLNRTEFMPFAPVVRDVDSKDFFMNVSEVNTFSAQFMTLAFEATERCKNEAPATVHIDGSARPQILRREINPGYYDILTEYKKITGLSILVNTSFNMHEEPIVCSPDEAIKAFFKSDLDILILGPYLIENERK